ncbi:MarR family transcriptional regulator [Paenibacillus sp. 1A_MP2]|uniref:MarR family transcriptional regulator n=1 Tax=Paenibacillus sp. 1A_MP2 TaxID=3457495 RepID=UPI003FCCEA1A
MPEGSYPFPIYSGILEPDHYKNIGNAIWLFLWCISSTTKEIEEEETVWGIVLGGKPMKLSEIAGYFGVNDKTVSRWMDALEQHQYINVTRAPRGLILKVRNSKRDQTKMSDQSKVNRQKCPIMKLVIRQICPITITVIRQFCPISHQVIRQKCPITQQIWVVIGQNCPI